MRQAFAQRTALAEQPPAAIESPYRVITAIRILRRELGLTSNDLVTLQALISFLPKKNCQISAQMTVVFPSNASLSERTNGLDERTIRRCVCRLVDAGLICRRDSATRKRFPLRYDGEIRDAFGFDLAPMYRREAELKAWAAEVEGSAERLRSLRAKALALRVTALKQTYDADSVAFLTRARNILRRATVTLHDIMVLIQQMSEMIGAALAIPRFPAGNPCHETSMTDEMTGAETPEPQFPAGNLSHKAEMTDDATSAELTSPWFPAGNRAHRTEVTENVSGMELADPQFPARNHGHATEGTDEMTGADGPNDRHVEPTRLIVKKGKPRDIRTKHNIRVKQKPETNTWTDFRNISMYYPNEPRDAQSVVRIITDVGSLLGINPERLICHLRSKGPARLLTALDAMIARAAEIRHPPSYLEKMMQSTQ